MTQEIILAPEKTGIVAEFFHHDPGKAREKIFEIEARLMAAVDSHELPAVEMPLRHSFIPGGYARELTIPAGVLLVGHIHKDPCFNFVTKGHITVLTEEGIREIVAPASFPSSAGVKRVGYTHEETVWTTVHVTDETDPDKMIEALTVPDYEAFAALMEEKAECRLQP